MQTQGPEWMRSEHSETKGRPSLMALPEGVLTGRGEVQVESTAYPESKVNRQRPRRCQRVQNQGYQVTLVMGQGTSRLGARIKDR